MYVCIVKTLKILAAGNLGKIRGRIPARFWPPGLLLPSENLGEVRGRNRTKILAAGIFASRRESWRVSQQDPGEILATGNFVKKNPGGQNLAGIPAGFPPRSRRDPAKIPVLILQGYMANLSDFVGFALTVTHIVTVIAKPQENT